MSWTDHHASHPHDHSGSELGSTRSQLKLRLIGSIVASVATAVAAILLVVAANADETNRSAVLIAAGICLGVALIAAVEVFRVVRRLRRGDHGGDAVHPGGGRIS